MLPSLPPHLTSSPSSRVLGAQARDNLLSLLKERLDVSRDSVEQCFNILPYGVPQRSPPRQEVVPRHICPGRRSATE